MCEETSEADDRGHAGPFRSLHHRIKPYSTAMIPVQSLTVALKKKPLPPVAPLNSIQSPSPVVQRTRRDGAWILTYDPETIFWYFWIWPGSISESVLRILLFSAGSAGLNRSTSSWYLALKNTCRL